MDYSWYIKRISQFHDSMCNNPNYLHILSQFSGGWRLVSRTEADYIDCASNQTLLGSKLRYLSYLRRNKMTDMKIRICSTKWLIVRFKILTFRIWYSTDFSSSQIATLILIGITVGITAILSTVNLSSFIVIWMVFNQMRMLVLMLLTDAYFPSQVYNYLVGQKIFSFNFSFLSIHSISKLMFLSNPHPTEAGIFQ